MKKYLQFINEKTTGANGLIISIILYLIFVYIDITTNDNTSLMGFYIIMIICSGSILAIGRVTGFILKNIIGDK